MAVCKDTLPSALRMGTDSAQGFDLAFSKRSQDGSGKATLVKSASARSEVHGALYSIADSERMPLRKAEGGYEEVENFAVRAGADEAASVVTFIAPPQKCDASFLPYDWYVELVTLGARQSDLAPEYVEVLRAVRSQPDFDTAQASVPRSIIEIAARGMVNARR